MGVANYDVVIVGAGAAGLSAAIGLARNDFSVLVVEAGAFPGAENWSGCVYFAESLAQSELLGATGVEDLAWERRLVERGIFNGDGHSFAGVTYRDPHAFRNCYTVLRPIFDHHIAQWVRQAGATILADTTAEGLIRERGRVIGISTQRGPIYADLVFLAEGDASHLVTKEGLEQAATGRQDAHFLQGVKQVIEMPPNAIEEIFGVGSEEGVAYEMLLRNGTMGGREVHLNMGGFLYTNRDSISLGFVLPLRNLHDGFAGDPNLLMEWLRGIPQIRRWTHDGTPGVFGAKLIRGGGVRDLPHLIDHGLAVGGAASAIGVDFPYPNFTGPATGMGLLLTRAAVAIRRDGGSFSLDELRRHYLEPLRQSHWFDDVRHLRRWPTYVEKTRFFFSRNIDALQGSLVTWTRSDIGFFAKWARWVRVMRRTVPYGRWGEFLTDSRQFAQALGLREVTGYRPIWRILTDGCVNSVRDLLRRRRAHVEPAGRLTWHFSILGADAPTAALPKAVINWGKRFNPVLSAAAREIYRNDPVALREKLGRVLNLLIDQISLLDVLAIGSVGFLFLVSAACQAVVDVVRRSLRRGTGIDRGHPGGDWSGAAPLAYEPYRRILPQSPDAKASAIVGPISSDSWEDKLGRLSYETTKDPHIKLFWPRELADRAKIADAGIWHVCPAKVYECHADVAGQVRLVVNHENCIKCESCWRATDLVDWGRNGAHQLIYRVTSPAIERLLDSLDRAMERRPRPAKARDWWTSVLKRIAQRATIGGGNGQFAGEFGRLESLCTAIEAKLLELDRSLSAEPRTVDQNRARWIELIATYSKQLVEELVTTVREGPLAQTKDGGLRDLHAVLVETASSLRAKMAELAQRTYNRQFFWAAADSRQIVGHHLEGLRRVVRLLRGRLAPVPVEPAASERWLAAERAKSAMAAFREQVAATIDEPFDRLAWRAIDHGTPLDSGQVAALKGLCRRVQATGLAPSAERRVVLTELGRRIPSLAYVVASHFWARDLLRVLGGSAFEDLVARLASGNEIAAFAWEGSVDVDRDDEGIRLRGHKLFVPAALAQWFVVVVDDQLIVLPRETPGLRIEPLGTIGMRGSAPATLVFDNVSLPASRRRVDKDQLERLFTVQSTVDLAAIACGIAERLEFRATEHAKARVQFPGLFLDDEFRESIGKFGAVKKMLAQIGARRYVLDTLVHQFSADDLSDDSVRRALELKVVAADATNGHPSSITYNTTQIFGGTGYSEEDFLPMFYRDGSTLLTLGVPSADAAALLGQFLLRRRSGLAVSTGHGSSPGTLVGLAESALFDETSQRMALQHELETLRRVRHEVDAAVARWQSGTAEDPQSRALTDVVADGLGRRQAEFRASESLLLRTHARLEAGFPAELEIELLRSWLQDAVDAAHEWVDLIGEPECHIPLPSIQPGAMRSVIQTSYQSLLDRPAPYQTGDYLVESFEPGAGRYVPELVPFDPELGRYDRELDELLRANYRDRLFDGLSYERYVERQHKLDPADFELFRKHGFLKMYVPAELGGIGASKAKYNLLVKNLIRNGDVGQTLTVQANTSIGTVPVLLGLYKELPRAKQEITEFQAGFVAFEDHGIGFFTRLGDGNGVAAGLAEKLKSAELASLEADLAIVEQILNPFVAHPSPAVRVLYHDVSVAIEHWKDAIRRSDRPTAQRSWHSLLHALKAITRPVLDETIAEFGRRSGALKQFLQWIASGQMTAFALTEPSAGSDTARVATRAVLRSVDLHLESDGSYRFTPAAGGGDRRMIDAARLDFRPDGVFYRWSDRHEPARIMFDEYDYEADDSDRPRYYMAGPVKVPFHDIAQIRTRNGRQAVPPDAPHDRATENQAARTGTRLCYDYWEMNGAKMWLTNARMCGVMVLYAKTEYGVTSFYVDRHAEGLLVGKNEEKMGQQASVTNELGLQAVRVPRENVNGLEGRGQVNALESLNAGRSGLTTSSATSMENLIADAERFALDRRGQLTPLIRHRLEEMAEIRYMSEALACELVVRADHRDTRSFRVEPSIGKMMTSELLMRVIQLCEDIYGLEGHTTLYNLEKHKRDQRIITVYEGTNDIQRTVILKDLVREVAHRASSGARSAVRSVSAGSDKLHAQRGMLDEMKRELARVLNEARAGFGDEILSNPSMQSVFFGLSDVAAWIKLADAALGRSEWVLQHLDASRDASYRDWAVRIARRAVARARHRVRQRLAHVSESVIALRQGVYPPEIRAAGLMMAASSSAAEAPRPTMSHDVSRAIQIVVVLELDPTISPNPAVSDGCWNESHYRLESADSAALAIARSVAAAATAPTRIVVVGAGPRRAAKIMEEALAAGADEAIQVLTDRRSIAPETTARALARIVHSECRSPDLVLTRSLSSSCTSGLVGMLVARELGLQFVPGCASLSVHFTEDEASTLVGSSDRKKPQRISMPAAFGVVAREDVPRFRISDYLAALERPVRFVAWPEEITRRFIRLALGAASGRQVPDALPSARSITPDQAARMMLETMGLRAESASDRSDNLLDVSIQVIDRFTVRQSGSILVVAGADPSGRLRPAEGRLVRAAGAMARQHNRPLVALVLTSGNEDSQRRVATELAQLGAGTVILAYTEQTPDPKHLDDLWSHVLMNHWSPDWHAFTAIFASVWAEPVLAQFSSGQAELILRVSELTRGPSSLIARCPRVESKVDTWRELPANETKPLWITTTDDVDCRLPPLPEVRDPHVNRWLVDIGPLPSRRDLMALLGQVREDAGVARLADADFIIDVGFGIGSVDGFEGIIPPLEKLLRDIGVSHVVVGGSRKVTEELKVLPAQAQIGQTGQSVNPVILLAIGISGAPQHLNYIGQRATILAFNRDAEAPIMTLNRLQPRPRVFPIVGDLFQTVPAFMAALFETERPKPADREPALAS